MQNCSFISYAIHRDLRRIMDVAGMVVLTIIGIWSVRGVFEELLDNEPFEAFMPTIFTFLSCWGISALWEPVFG